MNCSFASKLSPLPSSDDRATAHTEIPCDRDSGAAAFPRKRRSAAPSSAALALLLLAPAAWGQSQRQGEQHRPRQAVPTPRVLPAPPPAVPAAHPAPAQIGPHAPRVRIDLRQAIHLALAHNHTLRAERTLIVQSQANQLTASLRPNPVFDTDALFLPVFNPSKLNADNFSVNGEFDAGASYTWELGGKRRARMRAAEEQTGVTIQQVQNDTRRLTYGVKRRFIQVLLAESNLRFARRELKSFQSSLRISREQYKAGSISHGDLLKTQLQLLTFQTDAIGAKVALTRALFSLRREIGFGALPAQYAVVGRLRYQPLRRGVTGLEAEALRRRPDLIAARREITAQAGLLHLARANAVPNLTTTLDYTHIYGIGNLSAYATIGIPIFDRNQGNIALTHARIREARQFAQAVAEQVVTAVRGAYAQLQSNNSIVRLYRSGYLQKARQSLVIAQYAYVRGAASLLDFLDAERSYRTVELNYRQALAAAMVARARLVETVGTQHL
jgi:cobalt-zinc-cadmium efflux system outer membrane protein